MKKNRFYIRRFGGIPPGRHIYGGDNAMRARNTARYGNTPELRGLQDRHNRDNTQYGYRVQV